MPRDTVFPLTILKQINGCLLVKANALLAGYDTLNYKLQSSNKSYSTVLSDSDEVLLSKFNEGAGTYDFYMSLDNERTAKTSFYFSVDNDKEVCSKILSYISQPEDKDFMQSILNSMDSPTVGYTHQLLTTYSQIKNIQDYEAKSIWQLISMAERYENLMALTYNKNNVYGTICHYDAKFHITPSVYFTSVDIFAYNDKNQPQFISTRELSGDELYLELTPNKFYYFDFYCGAELGVRLVHCQLSEEGTAYIWEQQNEQENSVSTSILNDLQLAYSNIELSDEDKERIIEERKMQSQDYYVERVTITPDTLDPEILHVGIPEYGLLAAFGEHFYLSIVERDLFSDKLFDSRYEITSSTIDINIRKELMDDELLFCIKDKNNNVVSKYTRYSLQDNLDDYSIKQNAIELAEYMEQLKEAFISSFGNNEYYTAFLDVIKPLSSNIDMTLKSFHDSIVLKVAISTKLRTIRDNLIYFLKDNWMNQFNYTSSFFDTSPTLYYSENRITFPLQSSEYLLVIESYDAFNQEVSRKYIVSSERISAINLSVNDSDLYCIYALDTNTKQRSGFVLFNNLGSNKYYHDYLNIEVVVYNG